MLEEPTTCRSGAPTQDGSRSSSMLMNISSISKTEKHLMYMVEEMKKLDQSLFGTNMVKLTRDGRSSTRMS